MAELSIIVPIYNSENTLKKCLDSLITQNYENMEIILVNDGSTDGSYEICNEYSQKDSRIKLISKIKNEGLVAARKTGIQSAASEFVGYVDGDDWIEPDLFELMMNKAFEDDSDLVMVGHYLETDTGLKNTESVLQEGIYDSARIESEIYPEFFYDGSHGGWTVFPYVWGKLFRKNVLFPIQLAVNNQIKIGEDTAVTYPYITKCRRISLIKKPLYHYSVSSGSMIKRKPDSFQDMSGYKKLYWTIKTALDGTGYADNLDEQLLHFMMNNTILPRAPLLLQNTMKWKDLFPFKGLHEGSRVAIYGAGLFGTNLYEYLKRSRRWRVVAWLDRSAETLSKEFPEVRKPQYICGRNYDHVLIAIVDKRIQQEAETVLTALGVEKSKIVCPDQDWIRGEELNLLELDFVNDFDELCRQCRDNKYADIDYPDIMEKNWSELKTDISLPGVKINYDLNEDEIKELRKAGINPIMSSLSGKPYCSKNGRFSMSKWPIAVPEQVQRQIAFLQQLQEIVSIRAEGLTQEIMKRGKYKGRPQFHFAGSERNVFKVIDTVSGIEFHFNGKGE